MPSEINSCKKKRKSRPADFGLARKKDHYLCIFHMCDDREPSRSFKSRRRVLIELKRRQKQLYDVLRLEEPQERVGNPFFGGGAFWGDRRRFFWDLKMLGLKGCCLETI
jgi:hypothetical protein